MHPYFDLPTPHLFAHRGASGDAPANTMPAFERAVALGIQYLETDCHPTRDGEIVLCHDETVDATTDGTGPICEYGCAELLALDAGYGFTSSGLHPFRGAGVKIPRLVELLERFPATRINLEVKQGGRDVVDEVIAIIRRANAEDRVLLAAESDEQMDQIHAAGPATAIGSSQGDVVAFFQAVLAGSVRDHAPRGHALQIPPTFDGNPIVTPEIIAAAHSRGLLVHVWTINDPTEMRELLKAGADGLMSDYPSRLRDVVGSGD